MNVPISRDNFMTTAEAAEHLGISANGVVVAIRSGQIDAVKFGKSWAILKREVYRYKRERRKPGNPNFGSTTTDTGADVAK